MRGGTNPGAWLALARLPVGLHRPDGQRPLQGSRVGPRAALHRCLYRRPRRRRQCLVLQWSRSQPCRPHRRTAPGGRSCWIASLPRHPLSRADRGNEALPFIFPVQRRQAAGRRSAARRRRSPTAKSLCGCAWQQSAGMEARQQPLQHRLAPCAQARSIKMCGNGSHATAGLLRHAAGLAILIPRRWPREGDNVNDLQVHVILRARVR